MINLGDPTESRMWARNWPDWTWHDLSDFQADVAWQDGYTQGRRAVYEELAPFLRWVLLQLPCDIRELDPVELVDVAALLRGDIKDLMGHAVRRRAQAEARAQADRAARIEREWSSA